MDPAAEPGERADRDGGEDDGEVPEEEGDRRSGHSKDHRDDLPQAVTAMRSPVTGFRCAGLMARRHA